MTRVRSRTIGIVPGGEYWSPSQAFTKSDVYAVDETCEDELGYPDPHALLLTKRGVTLYEPFNYKRYFGGSLVEEFKNYRLGWCDTTLRFPAHRIVPGVPTNSASVTTTLAATNPATPMLRLPVSLFELREVPRLLKYLLWTQMGRKARLAVNSKYLEKAAGLYQQTSVPGNYLSWEFGIEPIISDIKRLLDFETSVSDKMSQITQLYHKGGLRRKTVLFEGQSYGADASTAMNSVLITINGRKTTLTKVTKWGVVRWKPSAPPPATLEELRSLATSLVYGFSKHNISAFWHAMPWTWLTDWIFDVGEYFDAVTGRLLSAPGQVSICTLTHTVEHWQPNLSSKPGASGGGGSTFRTTKQRSIHAPVATVTAHLPFLGAWEVSILGSLFSMGKYPGRALIKKGLPQ